MVSGGFSTWFGFLGEPGVWFFVATWAWSNHGSNRGSPRSSEAKPVVGAASFAF